MKKVYVNKAIAFMMTILLISTFFIGPVYGESKIAGFISPKMGEAYAEVIRDILGGVLTDNVDSEYQETFNYAELVDFNGDGQKELYILYTDDAIWGNLYDEIWGFDGTSAYLIGKNSYEYYGNSSGYVGFKELDNKVYLYYENNDATGATYLPEGAGTAVFNTLALKEVSNKKIKEFDYLYNTFYTGIEDGAIMDEKFFRGENFDNKQPISQEEYNELYEKYKINKDKAIFHSGAGSPELLKDNFKITEFVESLKNSTPEYTYKNVRESLSEADINAIVKAIADSLGGKIVSIHKLADGIYYVVIEITSGYGGAILKEVKSDTGKAYKIQKSYDTLMTQEELDLYVREISSSSNIKIDYNKINEFTDINDYINYINTIIDETEDIYK